MGAPESRREKKKPRGKRGKGLVQEEEFLLPNRFALFCVA
jgi:hypothetical protein